MKWIELRGDLVNLENVRYIEKFQTDNRYSYIKEGQDVRYEIILHFLNDDNLVLDYSGDKIARDKKFNELKDKLC